MSGQSIKPVGKRRNKEEYIKRNSKYKCTAGVTIFLAECEKELLKIEQVEEQVKMEQMMVIRRNISNAICLLQLEEGE